MAGKPRLATAGRWLTDLDADNRRIVGLRRARDDRLRAGVIRGARRAVPCGVNRMLRCRLAFSVALIEVVRLGAMA
jgi:hypothetical protein